jgi:hypothetical protein
VTRKESLLIVQAFLPLDREKLVSQLFFASWGNIGVCAPQFSLFIYLPLTGLLCTKVHDHVSQAFSFEKTGSEEAEGSFMDWGTRMPLEHYTTWINGTLWGSLLSLSLRRDIGGSASGTCQGSGFTYTPFFTSVLYSARNSTRSSCAGSLLYFFRLIVLVNDLWCVR